MSARPLEKVTGLITPTDKKIEPPKSFDGNEYLRKQREAIGEVSKAPVDPRMFDAARADWEPQF